MSFNAVAAAMQYLPPELITKLAAALGSDRAMTMKAVSAAVPAILGGMAAGAALPSGIQALTSVLQQQDVGLLGKLGNVIGGAHQTALNAQGAGMLQTIMGVPTYDALAGALSKYSGVSGSEAKQICGLLAPVVAAALARHQREHNLTTDKIGQLLFGQKDLFAAALPSGWASVLAGSSTRAAQPDSISLPVSAPAMTSAVAMLADADKGAALADVALAAKAAEVGRTPVETVNQAMKGIASTAGVPKVEPSRPAVGTITQGVSTPPAAKSLVHGATSDSGPRPSKSMSPAPVVTIAESRAVSDGNRLQPHARKPAAMEAGSSDAAAAAPPAAQDGSRAHQSPHRPHPHPVMPTRPAVAAIAPQSGEVISDGVTASAEIKRRGLPLVAWLLPFFLIAAGGAWWLQDRLAYGSQAQSLPPVKTTANDKPVADASTQAKAEADALAVKAAAESRAAADARAAADTKAAADAKDAGAAVAARAVAEAKAAADAKSQAEAAARRIEAESMAAKQAIEVEVRRKAQAEATAAAAKAAADAETSRKAEVDAAAARVAAAAAAEAKAKADLLACQNTVRTAAGSTRVLFEFASATLANEGVSALARLADTLKACPNISIRVEGHTDNNGDLTRNQRLSESRAQSVVDALSRAGVQASRLAAIGFGQTKPLVANDNERNRARNRRIEFVAQ